MALFWIIAAALLLLAMALVARPLWRRPVHSAGAELARSASEANIALLRAQLQQLDQELAQGQLSPEQHRSARAEIERRVLDEEGVASAPAHAGSPRATLVLLLCGVPLLALGLYLHFGTPQAMSPEVAQAQGAPSPQQVEEMVARLAERMEKQPPGNVADTEGWVMLGRSYAVLQRYDEASRAFARALQLMPDNAQILVDQADVTAMQQGGRLEGEPMKLIERALLSDPANPKALALAGTAAFERRDFNAAIGYWSRARANAPADSEFARALDTSLADARAAGGTAGSSAPSASAGTAPAAAGVAASGAPAAARTPAGAASISGRVTLAPALAARVAPGDTLFVFARAAEGPRMPLAILKRSAAELPLSFTLDDSMAMTPQMKLSSFASVVIGARISKSGNATPQSGDLEGQSAPVVGGRSVEILIDQVRP